MTTPDNNLPTLIRDNVFSADEANQHGVSLKIGEEGAIIIYHIDPDSQASKTELCVGCEILSINDHRVATLKKADEMLLHYIDTKGFAKVVASKKDKPRGTKYVLVKNTKDKSIFEGGSNEIDGLELEQKDGYVRVASTPKSGIFSRVRISKGDCIWSINGTTVKDINQIRHELKEASGKIIFILTYNSFRKLKTTVMTNIAINPGGKDKWALVMGAVGKNKTDRLVDQYDIHNKLGEGAFAVVKRVTHKQTGDVYAVKIVNRSSLGKDLEKNLQSEIGLLNDMNHPHIMCLHNVYITIKEYHLVTEFLEGGELFDRIVAKDSYTESEARDVCKILFDALNYMAKKRVAHRDLKPENLLLKNKTSDSEIKIADFGFAKVAKTEEFLTTICGTPGYVGPEVLCKKKYGTKCDMWSMGVIVYILLGGYPPFYADTEKELFRLTKMGHFEFHEDEWSHISTGAKDLIVELLQTNPSKRASAQDVLHHPWMNADKKVLKMQNLQKSQVALKSTLAKQKLRKAMHTVRFLKGVARDNAVFSVKKKVELKSDD